MSDLYWFMLGLSLGALIGLVLPWRPILHPWRYGHVEMVHPHLPEDPKRLWSVVTVVGLWLAVVVAGVAVYGAFVRAAPRVELLDYQQCTAKYDTQLVTGIRERAEAFAEVDHALDRIVEAVARGGPDGPRRERIRAAITNYRDVRAAQEQTLRENPPPPLPRDVCGLPPKDE